MNRWHALLRAIPLVVILGLGLSLAYRWAAAQTGDGLSGALAINIFLALTVIALRHRGWLRPLRFLRFAGIPSYWLYAPGVMIFLGSLLFVAISSHFGAPTQAIPDANAMFLTILVVPTMEELTFRGGFSPLLQRLAGPGWGSYWSVLLFAWIHTLPVWRDVASLNLYLPLGPLLLGALAELLFQAGGKLGPSIGLHMACNATVLIFSWGDARIFDWLRALYH